MSTYLLEVEGMSCGGCVRAVHKMISKTLEIDDQEIAVDLDSKRASFDADESIAQSGALDDLIKKLDKRGFPSRVVNA